jgi:acyl-CoA thioesterase I
MDLRLMNTWRSTSLAVLALAAAGCTPQDDRAAEARAATTAPAPRSAAAGAPPAAATSSRPRVVILGDSLTAGLGLPREQSIPSLLQRRIDEEGLEYEVANAGVSGDTSAGGLSRLDWALEGDVKVLVIELGGNDGLRGLPPAAMKRNLAEIITRAKRRGIRVLLTGMEAPPNLGPAYTSEFRDVFRDLADELDVELMPFFLDGVAGNPALNQRDEIHPNPDGARIIERNLWRALEPLLDEIGT